MIFNPEEFLYPFLSGYFIGLVHINFLVWAISHCFWEIVTNTFDWTRLTQPTYNQSVIQHQHDSAVKSQLQSFVGIVGWMAGDFCYVLIHAMWKVLFSIYEKRSKKKKEETTLTRKTLLAPAEVEIGEEDK